MNRLDEPVLVAVPKPMQTEFGIHYRLESCGLHILGRNYHCLKFLFEANLPNVSCPLNHAWLALFYSLQRKYESSTRAFFQHSKIEEGGKYFKRLLGSFETNKNVLRKGCRKRLCLTRGHTGYTTTYD